LDKRLNKHNGLIKGGAKATRLAKDWIVKVVISKLKNRSEATKFEWNWKHSSKSGLENRIIRIKKIISEECWKNKIINFY